MKATATTEERYANIITSFKNTLASKPWATLRSECDKAGVDQRQFYAWFKSEGYDAAKMKRDILRELRNQEKNERKEADAMKKREAKDQWKKNAKEQQAFRHEVVKKAKENEQLMYNYIKKRYKSICAIHWDNIQDAVEDVYYRLLVEPSTLKISLNDEAKFRALLCTKAMQSMMNLRKQRKHNECQSSDMSLWYNLTNEETIVNRMEAEELQNLLEEAIATLPENVRGMVSLHYQGVPEFEAVKELKCRNKEYRIAWDEYNEQTSAYVAERWF